jgi:predicted amidohydrolase
MEAVLVQLDITWENKSANFARVRELLAANAPSPGSLVVLPEMFATGFSCDVKATRQSDPPEGDEFLSSLAREFDCCVIGGVITVGSDGYARNEAVVFGPDGMLKRFAKIHPFRHEQEVHTPGSEVATFSWAGFEIAPLVCYDLRFPESFRAAARMGASLMVVIANWPVARIDHWVTLLRARAIENQAYVIGVNRCGRDPELVYTGRSLVVDPHGAVLVDAEDGEKVVSAWLDPVVVSKWREDFPALRDARW